jgi:hypothetical protein
MNSFTRFGLLLEVSFHFFESKYRTLPLTSNLARLIRKIVDLYYRVLKITILNYIKIHIY